MIEGGTGVTYEVARQAAIDAGNRHMHAAGRSQWNGEDFNVAAAEFNRLWPMERYDDDDE